MSENLQDKQKSQEQETASAETSAPMQQEVSPEENGSRAGADRHEPAEQAITESASEGTPLVVETGTNGASGIEAETEVATDPELGVEELLEEMSSEDGLASGKAAPGAGPAAAAGAAPETVPSETTTDKAKITSRRRASSLELKKLKTENDRLAAECEVLRDRYLRLAAELDNFRKRTERDFYSRVQAAFAELVRDLLPVLDDLDRCLNVKDDKRDYEGLFQGVKLIQQKFAKVLEDRGVVPMQATGTAFDPNLHDALTMIASDGTPAGVVLEEHMKGYLMGDKVLRPAKVIVSK